MQSLQGFSGFQVPTLGGGFAERVLSSLVPNDLSEVLLEIHRYGNVVGEGEHHHRQVVDFFDEIEKEGSAVFAITGFIEQRLFGGESFFPTEDLCVRCKWECMASELQQVFNPFFRIHSPEFMSQLTDQ